MFTHFLYIFPKSFVLVIVNGLIVLGMYFKKRLVGPRILHLTIPSGCDHNCPFCITDIHGRGALKGRDVLSFEELQKLIDHSLDEMTLKFNFTSNGEPLLYPKIDDLIEYIFKRSRGKADIQIITNGTSIKKDKIDFYKKMNVSFWISLHSIKMDSWKKMHRPLHHPEEKYHQLMENIKILHQKGIGLTIHSVVTNLNYHDLIFFRDFFKELQKAQLSLTRLIGFEELALNNEQERELEKTVMILKEDLNEMGIRHNLEGFEIMIDEPEDHSDEEVSFYQENRCYINFLMRPVTDEGFIKSCNGGYALGKLADSEFRANEDIFRYKSLNIQNSQGEVTGCNCHTCPQLVMNQIANKYVLI